MNRTRGASARAQGRAAGALWLIVIFTGAFAFYAQSALRSETLHRLAFAANLVADLCYLGVTILLYVLMEPVSRRLSMLAAAFGGAGIAVGLASSFVKLPSITMALFGLQCALVGYLILRSSLIPRLLGALLGIGGLAYVISNLARFLAPALGARLSPYIAPIAIVGEGALCLWLLVKGVRTPEEA